MPKFNVTVPHILNRADVVDRLRSFSDRVRGDAPVELSDLNEDWDESGNLTFSFKAMGFRFSGAMTASDKNVTVNGQMPFAAIVFRSAIETQIAEKIRELVTI